jgi:hypothetical protein
MPHDTPQLPLAWRWPGPGPVTDYIDMELVIRELDDPIKRQVIAARFEGVAAVHRATKIAGIIAQQRKG